MIECLHERCLRAGAGAHLFITAHCCDPQRPVDAGGTFLPQFGPQSGPL